MRSLLFLFMIPFLLLAETSQKESPVPYAPLLPLEPQFPLYLSNQNRHLITLDQREMDRNVKVLRDHSFPWLYLVGSLAVALGMWYGLKLRKEKEQELLLEKQQQLKHRQFIEELANLKVELSKGPSRDGYLRLTELLEEQLSNRFKVRLALYSPAEIGAFLELLRLESPELKNRLGGVLERAYYVKFANDEPSRNDCEQAIQAASEMIS